jgi:hypothetical protein
VVKVRREGTTVCTQVGEGEEKGDFLLKLVKGRREGTINSSW